MDRISLIAKLINQKHKTTTAHEQYLSTLREYIPGSNLYMREVHFVAAANPDEPTSIADIANRLDVTAGAVSQIATRLEKKGYIIRERAANDKRQMIVILTEAGKNLYAHHREYDRASMQAISDLLEDFTADEIEKIIKYEQMCYKAFSTKREDVI